jgi:hypothetical protein
MEAEIQRLREALEAEARRGAPADKMTDRELDARCAELMGWTKPSEICHAWAICDRRHLQWERFDYDQDGNRVVLETITREEFQRRFCWRQPDGKYVENLSGEPPVEYSTDLNAAAELEREIERRGLEFSYSNALWELLRRDEPNDEKRNIRPERWMMATATARQRAEAFVGVMEAVKGQPNA